MPLNDDPALIAVSPDVLHAIIGALVRERDELLVAARRYETVRKLNPRQFSELYERNITSGQSFDDLVDRIEMKLT